MADSPTFKKNVCAASFPIEKMIQQWPITMSERWTKKYWQSNFVQPDAWNTLILQEYVDLKDSTICADDEKDETAWKKGSKEQDFNVSFRRTGFHHNQQLGRKT